MSFNNGVSRLLKVVKLLLPAYSKVGFSALLAFVILLSSCQRVSELDVNESIVCDLETISDDQKNFIPNTHPNKRIGGAERVSGEQARSGNHSVMVMKGRKFGLTCYIKDSNSGEYYEAIVWRKGQGNNGYLSVSDEHDLLFYKSENIPDSIDADGWERLRLAFFVPPRFKNVALKFYVWNESEDASYFDDLSISRKNPEPYPEYKNIADLKIFVDTLNALKILNKRDEAFKKGILETQDDDWTDGMMFSGEDLYKIELRLKGDWLDHLVGSKWSFRIETDKGTTWRGMRTFSVQSPKTRDFLNEWLMLKFCRNEDILATRYDFIPLKYNGRSLGIYAWEEHFEKYLVESNSRREGPILKVNENAMWKTHQIAIHDNRDYWLPFIPSAEILPFKSKRTSRDSTLFDQYKIAQELYYQYKFAQEKPTDIFDVEKMARYLAMLDLFGTYHGITWHNQRFYYNPVISRLEPIAFDNFSEVGPVKYIKNAIMGNYYIHLDTATDMDFLLASLFCDSVLGVTYANYLEKYSNEDFIQSQLHELDPQISYIDSLLKREYPTYQFDPAYLFENARAIRKELPAYRDKLNSLNWTRPEYMISRPEYDSDVGAEVATYFVKAYTMEHNEEDRSILVENYFTRDIILLGSARNDKRIRNYLYPELRISSIDGREPGKTIFKAGPEDDYLFFMVDGDMITYHIPVYPWPSPEGKTTPRQKLISDYGDYYRELFVPGPGEKLILEKGEYRIDKPLLIPKGYEVVFEAGVHFNMVEGAAFISYSSLKMNGNPKDPIIIKSSDGSANGFTVLQADRRSSLEHVIFDRLNTLNIEGWKLTGAVTFYESDVDFNNVSFRNNLCEDGLNIIRSQFILDHCELVNTFADALDVDFGQGSILNTDFRYLSNDGIDVSGSEVSIYNCTITQSADKGISGGENSKVDVLNTRIIGTQIGIASKDQSRIFSRDCVLEDCNYGVVVFRKKPEFGPAFFEGINLSLNNITTVFLVEQGSNCTIDGKVIPDDKENVYDLFYE